MRSSANYYLQRIESIAINAFWGEIAPKLQATIDEMEEDYKVENIKMSVEKNGMQLWAVFSCDGNMTASFITYFVESGQRLVVFFGGGSDMNEWIHLFDDLLRWGKDNGCRSCEIHGRPGWEKVLKPYGFQKKKIVLKKTFLRGE